jgi:hypothetical protein
MKRMMWVGFFVIMLLSFAVPGAFANQGGSNEAWGRSADSIVPHCGGPDFRFAQGETWEIFTNGYYKPCFEPQVIIPNVLLYTSETGFFKWADGGPVNTCTIVSEYPISALAIASLCGSLPEDTTLSCNGPVWKMTESDEKGTWECDPILDSWRETRLPLFGDDGGTGEGTLYYVYMRHLSRLAQ